ncbi:unnamed protein product [Moritella viscosa]|uniref:Uncharacterized protein n=1 Tax=Moritella viscosa TaxID=80854 RepID=A0A1K9ZV01_9GAMM|nr:unnamed protein product [Moritella viscosa]SGY95486.1 unnamed protein product [Moritella viscosa]SGY95938.1 unnamed protein product [Moritella viscosa]SGZ00717.1 unnamed protein product [Moritella viscosa]SGZ17185.1 unnamed protein product [Moritella viscosa]
MGHSVGLLMLKVIALFFRNWLWLRVLMQYGVVACVISR